MLSALQLISYLILIIITIFILQMWKWLRGMGPDPGHTAHGVELGRPPWGTHLQAGLCRASEGEPLWGALLPVTWLGLGEGRGKGERAWVW